MAMGNAYYYYAYNILEGQVQYIMHNTKKNTFESSMYTTRSRHNIIFFRSYTPSTLRSNIM